uniref:microtubule-associated protein futsch isoform X2 n=1 Tax=Doryrhamphus excisus TaxID=161450 RepID=UPI0025ADEB1C|nr:microtubule-associated protein futsch isoform X2 [Doryrhamphus excisus]
MEKNYPVLKRPKRKLLYLPSIQNSRKEKWGPKLSLGDVDRMFDDLDCVSDVEAPPLSLTPEDCEESQDVTSPASPVPLRRASRPAKCQTPPREAQLSPATQPLSPELHIHIPIKGHGPMKTSSPIEMGRGAVQTESNEKDKDLSPILFDCQEAEGRTQPSSGKKANEDVSQKHLHSDFESPPSLVVLCKHTSSLKNRMGEPLHNESPTERKVSRQSPRQEPRLPSPEGELTAETSVQVKKDMSAFLRKLRDAGQPKATVLKKPLAPMNPPSEPEDDFLILEDEVSFHFSIPSKSTTTPQRSKRSSSDKDGSTDKGSKGRSPERTPKQPSAGVSGRKPLKDPTVGQRATKREKRKNAAGTGGSKAPSPDDIPAAETLPRDISSKKKAHLQEKVLPDTAEDHQKEPARRQTDDEKAQTSSRVRRLKSSKPSRDNLKTSRPAAKVKGICQKPSSKERADLGSPSEPDMSPVQDSTAGKPDQNKRLGSGESSPEEGQVLGKRKRNPPGEWWLNCPQNTEQLMDPPPSVKKSKRGEASAGAPSPAKAEKQRPFKRPSKVSKKTKGAKVKQKNGLPRDATDAIELNRDEAEQMDAREQEVAQRDLEPLLSSPLDLIHRDQSHMSEHQPFQRVYPHPGRKKVSHSPVPLSPRGSLEQLSRPQPSKRNRKPPGEWWKATSTSEDAESSPPELLPRRPKKSQARKERKTGSKQRRTPAAGGALVSPLAKKALWVPKSIKSSMGTFKNIFSSHTEGTVVLSNEAADQNNEVQSPDHPTSRNTHQATVDIDGGDFQTTFSILRSGPSSMIDLEMHKDTGPSLPRPAPAELSVCDLCAPPLKPFVLQPKDKANLTRWLGVLWSTTLRNASKVTPDHFDWYTHRGRVMGVMEDLHCGNISHGKILLGSFMRKPLWVDHSATTVFNLLTSSVNVAINCTESCVHAGQSFMVPCGHAYSIQNLVAQPVVLCFTRVLAESPD